MSAPVCKRMRVGYEKMNIGVGKDTSNIHLTNQLETYVMVVDDDLTTLSLVAAMLRTWKYQVMAVRNPMDAISTLRISHTRFDLVVTDLHMPQMNGIELRRQVDEEFKIPVVIMSSNDEDSVIRETIKCGAVFYLVKPVTRYDLKNVWQYSASAKKKCKAVVAVDENRTNRNNIGDDGYSLAGDHDKKKSVKDSDTRDQGCSSSSSTSPANKRKNGAGGDKNGKKDKRKSKKRSKGEGDEDDEEEIEDDERAPKKPKVVWTSFLHNRFLQAIGRIGLDRAVPKKILEFMAVPGLTRENIASHLQKYRLFLKRVEEQGNGSCKIFTERDLRSSFAQGHHPWLMFNNNLQQNHPHSSLNLQVKTTQFNAGLGFPSLTFPSLGLTPYTHSLYGASTSKSASTPRLGYGQSSLLNNNQPSFTQSSLGNHNLLNHAANRSVLASNYNNNNVGTNCMSGLSNALLSGTTSSSSAHIYQRRNQARPYPYTNTTTPLFNFNASAGFGTRIPIQDSNSTGNTNNNKSNDDQGGHGLMNGSSGNNNLNVPPIQTNRGFGSSSGVFGSTINQIPPRFDNNNDDNDEAAASAGGGRDYTSNMIINNNDGAANSPCDKIAHQLWEHVGVPDDDLSDIFMDANTKFQQQEVQIVKGGADFMDASANSQYSPTFSELMNTVDLLSSYQVDDNHDPRDEQLLGQNPGTEPANPSLDANSYPLDDYIPILEEQQNGGTHVMDCGDELSRIFQGGVVSSGNQQSNDLDMEDDLDALLHVNAQF